VRHAHPAWRQTHGVPFLPFPVLRKHFGNTLDMALEMGKATMKVAAMIAESTNQISYGGDHDESIRKHPHFA
jgi:hypothetical protein